MDANQPAENTTNTTNYQDQPFIFGPSALRHVTSTANSNRVLNVVNAGVMRHIFNFFQLSPEVRNMVYEYLWGDTVVVINGNHVPGAIIYPGLLPDLTIPNSVIPYYYRADFMTIERAWLRISRQFFREARHKLWECMDIQFNRRWDFINAAMNRSLDPRNPFDIVPAPSVGYDSWAMFPFQVDLFQNIRNLHINMSSFDDFSGVVSTPEGRRAISHPLSRLAYFMPKLRGLIFTIDERSKIADADQVMLPFAWLLELLRDVIDQHHRLVAVRFMPGPGYRTGRFARLNGRYCLFAMDGVFQEHMAAVRGGQGRRLDVGAINGVDLRRYFGSRMIEWFVVTNDTAHTEAKDLLRAKVNALQ